MDSSLRALAASAGVAVRLGYRAAPRRTVLLQVTTALLALGPVLAALALRALVDALTARQLGPAVTAAVLGAVVGLVSTALQLTNAYLRESLAAALNEATEAELATRICGFVGLRYFEDPAFRDRLAIAGTAAEQAPGTVADTLLRLIQTVVGTLGFVTALLLVWPPMVGLLALCILPAVLGQWRLAKREARAAEQAATAGRENSFLRFMITERQVAQEMRIYGLGPIFVRRIVEAVRTGNRLRLQVAAASVRLEVLMAAVAGGLMLAGTLVAVRKVVDGALTIGDLTLFTAAAGSLYTGLLALVGAFGQLTAALTLFSHYTAVTSVEPDLPTGTRAVTGLASCLTFEDVWFRYDEDGPWILEGLDLTIDAGQSVGLVGANGAGKSTIIKLLCRMYDPVRGRVLWDGVDLRELDPGALRSRLGVTFQDFVTYDASMRENIGFGDLGALDDLARVRSAAGQVGLDDLFEAMPRGYETRLSRSFMDLDEDEEHRGVDLSGGQRQRLALARSLMRTDADVWILDEPTAALDPVAEQRVHDLLLRHSAGRTSVLVSHRLSAVRGADRIVVVEDGRIVEDGTHDELVSRGAGYATMFRTQARGYVEGPSVGAQAGSELTGVMTGPA